MNGKLIQLENISKVYHIGETEVNALQGVNYSIQKGGFLAIMGPSGSGKSTLMNIVGCLDRPTEGRYILEDEEVSKLDKSRLAKIRNAKIGFVFQNFNLLPRTTALENAALPLLYSNLPHRQAMQNAMRSLASVGLKGREHHKTNQLSGGEMQRVAIARALVNNPSLILADEPTGTLDSRTGEEIMEIFRGLNENHGITLIIVTHDPDVAHMAHHRIHIRDGKIIKED